jgi:hypothetical protein
MTTLLLIGCLALGQPAALSVDADERRAFDFLVGAWELEQRIDVAHGRTERGDDRYVFRQPIRGGAIEASWRFNRGTQDKPDIAEAIYVSGYHTPSKAWSFYYVSERSAQHWAGRKSGPNWYFYFEEPFQFDGRTAIQRQWWERDGDTRVKRHFENSYDQGKSWQLVMTAVLRRAG